MATEYRRSVSVPSGPSIHYVNNETLAIVNNSPFTRLYILCACCRRGSYRWIKPDEWSDDAATAQVAHATLDSVTFSRATTRYEVCPEEFAERITCGCDLCGEAVTLTTRLIPIGAFTHEAYECSPDHSGAAAWIRSRMTAPRYWFIKETPPPPPEPEPEYDELAEIRQTAERMRQLIELHNALRHEFREHDEFLDELERIVDKKKRDIKGLDSGESNSDYDYDDYDDQ